MCVLARLRTAPLASATEQRCACAFDAAARRGFAGKASADASAVATQEAVPSPQPQPQPLAFAARASTDDWMQLGERDVGKFLSFSAEVWRLCVCRLLAHSTDDGSRTTGRGAPASRGVRCAAR
jgi:hypothetical protein